ncbi:MAG: DUF484 family protein [Gammaproteobacteria bacterium]|jgi:uncharacterized protein YigA (DUF484 family)|nr:DUF484 family protein [Gammaproteobacteria bacterium]
MSTEVSAAKEIIETSDNELGADQIADYLRKNPEFFIEQEGLLADLSLPHESGKAISLLERQVTILRDRGIEARQKLNNLLENARNNDQLFDTTRNLVMALLRANNLTEIVAVAQENLSNHTNIDACQIILIEQPQLDVSNAVKTDSEKNLKTDFADVFRLKRTHCGTLTQDQIDYLFADSGKSIRSTALCPVVNNSEVFALLAFGNQEENFFNINLDTLFLDFIGQVVGAVFYRMLAANSS